MARQLDKGQAAAITAMVQARDEINAAIEEYVQLLAAKYGIQHGQVQARAGGLWLVAPEEAED